MPLQLAKITEESKKHEYDARLNLTGGSYEEPQKDAEGYVIGILIELKFEEPTGEVKQNKKTGENFIDKQPQLKFVFEVGMENGGTDELWLRTNTVADGVKQANNDGIVDFSRLTKFLICIGAVKQSEVKPKSKITFDLNQLAEGTFKFKTRLNGRFNEIIPETIQLVSLADDSENS